MAVLSATDRKEVLMLLSIEDIVTEGNVRLAEEGIEGLARSMGAVGQITPITVTEYGDKRYLLVAGHRRLAAAQKLEWKEIEGYVVNGTGAPLALQVAENVARKDLTDYELAQGVLALNVETGMNQQEIADALGVDKKTVSVYQRIAKGSAGLDPVTMNQLSWEQLSSLKDLHEMEDEQRTQFVDQYEKADQRDRWYLVREHVAAVEEWRWRKNKQNAALIQAMEDIGAVPMEREERNVGKRLYGNAVNEHRGQPCHGYHVARDWNTDNFTIDEFCLSPESHKDSEIPELKGLYREAKAQGRGQSTVAERARNKARKQRKDARKEAVLTFSGKPKMKELTRAMIAVIRYEFRQYKWTELGKTFGLTKEKDQYHYDWDSYLEGFNAKDQVTQSLILGIGALYISLDSQYGNDQSPSGELQQILDEVFAPVFPDDAEPEATIIDDGGEEE